LGERARLRVREALDRAGVPGQVTGAGSLLRIHCTDRSFSNYRQFFPSQPETQRLEWLMVYLLNHGFLMTRMGTAALSTVMTEAEIDQFGETLFDGLRTMQRSSELAAD